MSRSEKRIRDQGKTHPPSSNKKRKLEKSHAKPDSRGLIVRGDQLRWKEVELPDRLEDAEGFFGLEEIDDVEVVTDVNGKNAFFRSTTQVLSLEDPSTDDEWAGFDDVEVHSMTKEEPQGKSAATASKSNGPLPNLKKRSQDETRLQEGVHFGLLEDVSDVDEADVTAWKDLQLSRTMLSAIAILGFSKPTPIQEAAIPPIRDGHDVIGKAVTGSGKTLAFGIPITEHWLSTRQSQATSDVVIPVALILAPTRELAHQLTQHLKALSEGLIQKPRIATVTGGLSILKQQRQLEDADIIIGTPGRLWEVISDSHGLVARLKQLKFLVVDEADRLLSEGHFEEVGHILDTLDRQVVEEDGQDQGNQKTKAQRQTLVFSATFHKGLQQKLTGKSKIGGGDLLSNKQSMDYLLKKLAFRESKPTFVDSNPTSQMASALEESIVECGAMQKDLYLYGLVMQNLRAKILVFTNSISSVRRLTPLLQNLEQPAVALHSTMIQKARLRSLEKFTTQRTILVATDVAARGLDIQGIDLIIHYHVPRTADMYVHRSGRTARAESSGKSILLCSPDEVAGVRRLISQVHGDKTPDVMQIDRQLITRLTPRMALSRKLTDATIAKEKTGSQNEWLRTAAEELGADYDSEEFAAVGAKNSRGRGGGKKRKQQENAVVSKAEVAGMRAQLKDLLSKKVNLGISERYLAGGRVDVDAMLAGNGDEVFLTPNPPKR